MFERFTDQGRRVIVLAQAEAQLLNHDYVGTEHLLLGVIEQGGTASELLRERGVASEEVRATIEQIVGRGVSPRAGQLAFTPRVKEIFELALRDAIQMRHDYISPEHLFLGMLREGGGVGVTVLDRLGADPSNMKSAVMGLLQTEAAGSVTFAGGTIGGDQPSETGDPRCPGCKARLIESASYRILEVAEHRGESHRRVLFLFCLSCGLTIDNEILPE